MKKSNVVFTDSDGIWEVSGLGKSVLVVCDTTERPEVDARTI